MAATMVHAADPAPTGRQPACGPQALGTARVLSLPRASAAYGRMQHGPLPLAPREVVLSFDDGPDPRTLDSVLQALQAHCARATFFMPGQMLLRHADAARRVQAAGHTVGLHGHSHANFTQLSPDAQQQELREAEAAYREVLGREPMVWRYPYLAESDALRAPLAAGRYTVLSADLDIADWVPVPRPQMLVDRLMERLREHRGGLVLLHDPQLQTAQALPLMLQALKAEGYSLVHLTWTDAPPPSGIQLNQLGYLPGGAKWAAIPAGSTRAFELVQADTGHTVHRGLLGEPQLWPEARQWLQLADFSAFRRPGRYRLRVHGLPDSDPFQIDEAAYSALNAAALKAYYFNRASTALRPEHAGPWAREAGHPDTVVRVHPSAAGPTRPAGSTISAPMGWYDAGDYNKYVTNSGISTYTLLAAWEHYPEVFRAQRLNIPESGNALPDILNEALWNLRWMLAMQDPADGGVYHKLTDAHFDGVVMPDRTGQTRWVVGKGTAATLNFAAVMAVASRVFAAHEAAQPGLAETMRKAALAAWDWALAHPDVAYRQPDDIHTGRYDDARFDDEFGWAAAELFITTGEARFWTAMRPAELPATVPWWGEVQGLAWVSLAHHRTRLSPVADRALIKQRIEQLAAQLQAAWQASPVRLNLGANDFNWGSNSGLLNKALMLLQGYRLGGPRAQLDAAQAALDAVLGRNALGLSFVTGFGARPPQHPHHRPSGADGVEAPVPGFLVGGPNGARQDAAHCPPYPAALPALSYIDHFCSYASNEVAINWNAPLVYVSAALQALTPYADGP